jgi:general stress protein YciG
MKNNDKTSKRGVASMDEDTQRDIAKRGGKATSAKQDMSKLGKKGAVNQPLGAKRRGGEKSHRSN